MKLLVVGGRGGTNIAESFYQAAIELGVEATLLDQDEAYKVNVLKRKFYWYFLDKLPPKMTNFSQKLIEICRRDKPSLVLITGFSPITPQTLILLKQLNIRMVNYSTDDPWNPNYSMRWFLQTLRYYDHIFTPRRANVSQFKQIGCANIDWLPFGFDHKYFYPRLIQSIDGVDQAQNDVIFVGGADADREPYIAAIINSKLSLKLFGSYWDRYRVTNAITSGQASPDVISKETMNSRVALCLVRRANRDGNCMRSFEIPAIGTCMLTEDTSEHRELFGSEGQNTLYFKTVSEMLRKLDILMSNKQLRSTLASNLNRVVYYGKHSYKDRLQTILDIVSH